MPVKFERKLFTTGGSVRVNIPSPILEALKLKAGDTITIWINDSQIIMEKKGQK
jgi:bifunctional DNA-binding transcriptional regulator/antitoxin component of YhaV-PrlF toxin-antitoxin module